MSGRPSVSVAIVSWNSARWLPACLDALAAQAVPAEEVVVVDNASGDDGAAIAARHPVVTTVLRNARNEGFAAGQNRAIAAGRGEWVLVLNPDVVLDPGFLGGLAARAATAPADGARRVGTLCGRLRRLHPDLSRPDPPLLDSTGIVFGRDFRHRDRDSQEVDRGQHGREEEVFGATAAAALYRRAMVEDVSVEGEFFDSAFFAYREDADVAWRAQILGWSCLYVPSAVGYHVRSVLPEGRRGVPAELNRHSVKNRFLMRIKNADAAAWRRCGAHGLLRDAVVVGGCLVAEWRSLPAFADLARLWPRAMRHRAAIRSRRRRGGDEIARWFA